MAQPLIQFSLLTLCMLGFIHFAAADGKLTDPTQPPAGLNIDASDSHTSLVGGSAVQMITVRDRHYQAMIHGLTVKVGDHIQEGKIIAITEQGVVIKVDHSHNTIELYPNVDKHPHTIATHDAATRQR